MEAAGATHTGYVRDRNEDAYVVVPERRLFAVADGLGGHPAGDVASRITIDTVTGHPDDEDREEWIRQAVAAAESATTSAAREDPELAGMGTTLVLAVLDPDGTAWIGNVGDSRAYRFADGRLQQVTADHSDATTFGKGAITRTVGAGQRGAPDVYRLAIAPGERLLLCTDGLSDFVPATTVVAALTANDTPQAACDALVDAALDAGGMDNVTVVVIDC